MHRTHDGPAIVWAWRLKNLVHKEKSISLVSVTAWYIQMATRAASLCERRSFVLAILMGLAVAPASALDQHLSIEADGSLTYDKNSTKGSKRSLVRSSRKAVTIKSDGQADEAHSFEVGGGQFGQILAEKAEQQSGNPVSFDQTLTKKSTLANVLGKAKEGLGKLGGGGGGGNKGGWRPPSGPCKTLPRSSGNNLKVGTYNLFWWNAFGQHPEKSKGILQHMRDANRDTFGLQEWDNAEGVACQTGMKVGRQSKGQGVIFKDSAVSKLKSGYKNIEATGHWGDRHVTWVKMRHKASGREFWQFNTHWCVRGKGGKCSSNVQCGGARNMLNIIKREAGSSPTIITGDFNAQRDSCGLRVFTSAGFTMAAWHWVDGILFSTQHFRKVRETPGRRAGSDHKSLLVELAFK